MVQKIEPHISHSWPNSFFLSSLLHWYFMIIILSLRRLTRCAYKCSTWELVIEPAEKFLISLTQSINVFRLINYPMLRECVDNRLKHMDLMNHITCILLHLTFSYSRHKWIIEKRLLKSLCGHHYETVLTSVPRLGIGSHKRLSM